MRVIQIGFQLRLSNAATCAALRATRRQVTRVRKDSEARVNDLAAENDALRRALATKMTRDEGEAWIEEMRAAREACQGEIETTREDVNRHRQRWERDVTKVNEELKLTNDECKERIERVVQRLEDHTSNDLHRTAGSCARSLRPFFTV